LILFGNYMVKFRTSGTPFSRTKGTSFGRFKQPTGAYQFISNPFRNIKVCSVCKEFRFSIIQHISRINFST